MTVRSIVDDRDWGIAVRCFRANLDLFSFTLEPG